MRSTHRTIFVLLVASSGLLSAQQGSPSKPQAVVPASSDPQLVKRPANPKRLEEAAEKRRQVTLDVFVTDREGMPVPGLHASDFRVFDDQKETAGVRFQPDPGSTPAADPAVEIVLLLDAINSSHESFGRAEDGVKRFLRADGGHLAHPVSILILSDQKPQIKTSLSQGTSSTFMPLSSKQAFVRRIPASQDGSVLIKDLDKSVTSLSRILAAQGSDGETERVQLSLQALDFIAAAEAEAPGRKILVWISPGWPLLAQSNTKSKKATLRRHSVLLESVAQCWHHRGCRQP